VCGGWKKKNADNHVLEMMILFGEKKRYVNSASLKKEYQQQDIEKWKTCYTFRMA
jgi:hypothetical protein